MEKRAMTLEDAFIIQVLSDVQITADGSKIAFVVGDSFKLKGKPAHSEIWIVETGKPETARPFTTTERSDFAPRWSPDGSTLAFISDRYEEKQQLYTIPAGGGEARPLTALNGRLSDPQWSADGTRIAFLFTPGETPEEKKRKEQGHDALVVGEPKRYKSLYTVDLPARKVHRVTPEFLQVWEYSWSLDNTAFALIASGDPEPAEWYRAQLMRIGVNGGEPQALVTPWPKQIAEAVWSPDSSHIDYISCSWSDQGAVGGEVFRIPASGGETQQLTPGYTGSVISLSYSDPGYLILVAHTQGEVTIGKLPASGGEVETLWRGMAVVGGRGQQRIRLAADGVTFATTRQDPNHPAEVFSGKLGGEWQQLTFINQALVDTIDLPRVESITWKSSGGQTIQGFLIYPLDYVPGERYPLLVQVHGGPASAHVPRFYSGPFDLGHHLAARKFATLLPNPRGSFGWGTAFTEANIGDLGGMDLQDILSGADYLIEQGLADPARQAIAGWSYGGQMVAWTLTQTDRFQAAVMGAAITNLESYYGQNNIYHWQTVFMQSTPYTAPEQHRARSAIHHIQTVRTPTLILHGAEDKVVPVAQAYEYYRALRDMSVPTEMVVYPREGHGISEQEHQRDMLQRILSWLDTYVASLKSKV